MGVASDTFHKLPTAGLNALDRLHDKGMIGSPANKAKSVVLTDDGL
jgi:Domain of unknown function (DUF6429)